MRLIGYDPRARQLYLPRLQPLAQYLGRRSADKSALLPVAILGVLEGVAKLHEHGVCHRDLKLDNVLIAGPLALVPPGAGLTLIPTLTPTQTPTLSRTPTQAPPALGQASGGIPPRSSCATLATHS